MMEECVLALLDPDDLDFTAVGLSAVLPLTEATAGRLSEDVDEWKTDELRQTCENSVRTSLCLCNYQI